MFKKKDLTAEYVREQFNYDEHTGSLTWKVRRPKVTWGSEAGNIMDTGYRKVKINYKNYKAHRIIWLYVYGEFPDDEYHIDHINGDRADNRLCNLRLVTTRENCANSYKHRNGKLLGTSKNSTNTWRAEIYVDGKKIYLGSYGTEREAHEAYMAYLQEHNLI